MTNQIQGETLFAGWEGGDDVPAGWAYTPWMPVRGDYATFAVQVLEVSSTTLTWQVQTRTAEDPAATIILGASGALTINSMTTGIAQNSGSDKCKQLVRYRFSTSNSASTSNFVHFRALAPSWQADR